MQILNTFPVAMASTLDTVYVKEAVIMATSEYGK
jgi:hypothetical protein